MNNLLVNVPSDNKALDSDAPTTTWVNDCQVSIPRALNFLADCPPAADGSPEHDAVHLLSLADELELTIATVTGVKWSNGCDRTVPRALRFLAKHPRPSGGEQTFNAIHLYQLADEIKAAFATMQPPSADSDE
jgi:hypothetical protein